VKGADGECAIRARGDSSFTVAVLAHYSDLEVAEVLDVCADERVPRGWTIDDTNAEASAACPGVERKGSSTFRMRRVR